VFIFASHSIDNSDVFCGNSFSPTISWQLIGARFPATLAAVFAARDMASAPLIIVSWNINSLRGRLGQL